MHDAAARLIAQKGYGSVSMRQVAQATGVQVGTLYLYTKDKQTLLADLMIGYLEAVLQDWHRQTLDSAPPEARLRGFVRHQLRMSRDHPDLAAVVRLEMRSLTAGNFARVDRLRRMVEAVVQDILQDGLSNGVFYVADQRMTTRALMTLLDHAPSQAAPSQKTQTIHEDLALRLFGVGRIAP